MLAPRGARQHRTPSPRHPRVAIATLLGCALLSACGGGEFSTDGGSAGSNGTAGSGAGGSGAGGSGTGGGPTGPSCPAVEPVEGSTCANGLACSFGDAARPSCRPRFECQGGKWTRTSTGTCARDTTCPLAPPATGADCLSLGQLCDYPTDGALCGCPPCTTFCSSVKWQCAKAPGGKCPRRLPNEGSECTDDALSCSYGSCALDEAMTTTCTGKRWRWSATKCPAPS